MNAPRPVSRTVLVVVGGCALAVAVWWGVSARERGFDPTPSTTRYEMELTVLDREDRFGSATVWVDHASGVVRVDSELRGEFFVAGDRLVVPVDGVSGGAPFVSVDSSKVLPVGVDVSIASFDRMVALDVKECMLATDAQRLLFDWLLGYELDRYLVCGNGVKRFSSFDEAVGAGQRWHGDEVVLPPADATVGVDDLGSDAAAVMEEFARRFGDAG